MDEPGSGPGGAETLATIAAILVLVRLATLLAGTQLGGDRVTVAARVVMPVIASR